MEGSASHFSKPVIYATALAVVLLAVASAYRIAAFRDPVSFGVSREGIDVKVGEAKEQLTAAAGQLADLQAKLNAQERLRKSESDLQAKDAQVRSLLAQLQVVSQRADAPPALRAAAPRIEALARTSPPLPDARQAASEAAEREKLREQISSAGRDIETAHNIIQSIGR